MPADEIERKRNHDTPQRLFRCSIHGDNQNSLGNPSKDRQRFVDAVVLISAPDWSVKLSHFENLLDTPFEFGLRMLGSAKLKIK